MLYRKARFCNLGWRDDTVMVRSDKIPRRREIIGMLLRIHEHGQHFLRHLVPPLGRAHPAQGRRRRHTRLPAHMNSLATRPLFVYKVDHRL